MKTCTVFLERDGDLDDLFDLVNAGIAYNAKHLGPRVGTIAQCVMLEGGQMKIEAVLLPPRVAYKVRELFKEHHGEIANFDPLDLLSKVNPGEGRSEDDDTPVGK